MKNSPYQLGSAVGGTDVSALLQKSGLWRASSLDSGPAASVASGFAELDELLPGSGWPASGLVEILHDGHGLGELRLLMPGLAALSQASSRWILLVNPPWVPYPPALVQAGIDLSRVILVQPSSRKDYLWTLEKALASQSCSAVLAWPGAVTAQQLRRLQLASKEGGCLGALFRPTKAAGQASPAELRLLVQGVIAPPLSPSSQVAVKILKRRGGWETDFVRLNFNDYLNEATPDFQKIVIPIHNKGS